MASNEQSEVGQWIAALIVLVAMMLGYKACSSPDEDRRAAPVEPPISRSGNVTGAWAYMQQFVERELKSPGTADFPFGGHRSVAPLGNDRYHIKSYVNSQNSFGANVRTDFEGTIRQTETGWVLEELSFK